MPREPYIRGIYRQETLNPILIIFGMEGHIHDLVTFAIFHRFRINGSGVTELGKIPFQAYLTTGLITLLSTIVGASDSFNVRFPVKFVINKTPNNLKTCTRWISFPSINIDVGGFNDIEPKISSFVLEKLIFMVLLFDQLITSEIISLI